MIEFERRVQSALDAALEATFNEVSHGGDHESRKLIALSLIEAAMAGKTTLDELVAVGRTALVNIRNETVS